MTITNTLTLKLKVERLSERLDMLEAERDAAIARADKLLDIVQRDKEAAIMEGIAEGERRERERIVALIRADAVRCDCSAREESECACGAWDGMKRVYATDIANMIERGD